MVKKLVGHHEALLEPARLEPEHHAGRTSGMAVENFWRLKQHRRVVEDA